MTNSNPDLAELIDRAGFRRRAGATREMIARVEAAFAVRLPAEFIELWSLSDGMTGAGIEVLSLSQVESYAEVFAGGLGYVPFTDCNDSNPYAVCCCEPLQGVIAHVYHDDDQKLICRGLKRFFTLVADAQPEDEVDRISGDMAFDSPERTEQDAALAGDLLRKAQTMDNDDDWRGIVMHFAVQLLGPGREQELAGALALGNEYTRDSVRRRCNAIGTPAAEELLRKDEAAYQLFLTDLRQAFETAGVRTESDRRNEFRLQPGRVGLNFVKLYAECRRPGAMAEWVQRFKERIERK